MEEKGVGRPSTYATIVSTIQDREYVQKIEKRLSPTPLGEVVNGSVDERARDENGKLAVEKLHVITFDYANHGYYVLGEKVASAFEDGKKFK